jgi:Glycosyl transferase family 90
MLEMFAKFSLAYRHVSNVGRSTPFDKKDSRLFWRGVTWTSPDRQALLEVTKDHPDVADVVELKWNDPLAPAPADFVSTSEMCSWKYIIYTEGFYDPFDFSDCRTLI